MWWNITYPLKMIPREWFPGFEKICSQYIKWQKQATNGMTSVLSKIKKYIFWNYSGRLGEYTLKY